MWSSVGSIRRVSGGLGEVDLFGLKPAPAKSRWGRAPAPNRGSSPRQAPIRGSQELQCPYGHGSGGVRLILGHGNHVPALLLSLVHGFVHSVKDHFLGCIGVLNFSNADAYGEADFLLVVNEPGILD